ncbi:MAG TPA: YciI family protein [Mycobacteriales bacterium]|jgi:hypothetical protein|nr:YciI family protein [Mycobacteriales bacterium]
MEYVLLIVGDDDAYQALDAETGKAMYAQHFAFMDEMKAAGVALPYSAELQPPGTARTLHPDGTVTDGPYAETKEQLGGFYVLDVPTIEEAVDWARRIPLLPGDVVEVRPAK